MMSFKDALNKLIFEHGIDILNDKFKTRSYLYDLVGFNHYENKLIENFWLLNYVFNLVDIFEKKGLREGRFFLEQKYENFKDDITKKEYVDSINPIALIICSREN